MTQEPQTFIGYEVGWKATACPNCGKLATSHGFLYSDPPPEGEPDERRPFAHVYLHAEGADCVVQGPKYL